MVVHTFYLTLLLLFEQIIFDSTTFEIALCMLAFTFDTVLCLWFWARYPYN